MRQALWETYWKKAVAEWLVSLLAGAIFIRAHRRRAGKKYTFAQDLWEAVWRSALIREETGSDPISEVIPDFFVERDGDLLCSGAKLEDFQKWLSRNRQITFKDNAGTTHGVYNSNYGFRAIRDGGFRVSKSWLRIMVGRHRAAFVNEMEAIVRRERETMTTETASAAVN